jgi:hypothetical protein
MFLCLMLLFIRFGLDAAGFVPDATSPDAESQQ